MNLKLTFKEQILKLNKEEQETYLFYNNMIVIGRVFSKR